MRRTLHPWGTPPWTIDFRPASQPLPDRVGFAVVGGGFAGLSAAAWLARLAPGKSVLVLESGSIGNGASGRTGGMVLDETAAGPLPGLGNVLAGYRKILGTLNVEAELALPGVWELARRNPLKNSPIHWNDSGDLQAVAKVPGGSVDPGKVVVGLARAGEKAGVQIVEHAEVVGISSPGDEKSAKPLGPITLRVRFSSRGRSQQASVTADQVLLATNAGSLGLAGLAPITQPKLTVDFPYLWGRLLANGGVIFGAGLLPRPTSANSPFATRRTARPPRVGFGDLLRFDVRRGATRECFDWLETRVHNLHRILKGVRITHRWGGPILFTKDFKPIFRHHTGNKRVLILAGFCGHGVALSVYLGHRAAQVMLGLRELPAWATAHAR